MKPYAPTPGTIPYRTAEVLRALPPGESLSSAALAEAVDQPGINIAGYLLLPRQHGYLAADTVDGLLRWRMGNGTPLANQAERDEDRLLPITRRTVPTTAASGGAASEKGLGRPRVQRARRALTVARPATAAEGASAGAAVLRVALWSDGALAIERDGERLLFNAAETRQIVMYLDRFAEPT